MDQSGPANHNWRGGISRDNYHYKKLQMERYPERIAARVEVYKEIRAGRLIRGACEVCGETNTQAHHDDYSQPLAVRWLCRKCHRKIHEVKK